MKILIACEFSGIVREAFAKKGHDVTSCDLLPTEQPCSINAEHYQGDVFDIIDDGWDMMIVHPPCTYLTCAGNKWFLPQYKNRFPDRLEKRNEAIQFVQNIWDSGIERICIENPIGVLSTQFRKWDQIIQPYQFSHTDRKPTCLWLKGLPKLIQTNLVEPKIKRNRNGRTASVHHDEALCLPPGDRWKARSRTYQGIAEAFATQYTAFIKSGKTVSEWENLLKDFDISKHNAILGKYERVY